MVCHVERKMCRDVPGVAGGYAITWDRGNNNIFFGGHNGIYSYNFLTNSVQYFSERGKSIWGLFVRRNFYYIQYPSQKLYVYKRKKFRMVPEASNMEIDNFFVTQQFEIYFSNKTGLYKVQKPRLKPYVLRLGINVKQITYDVYGDIYFCASDGIYTAEKRRRKIRKVAEINDMVGMDFHKAGNSEKTKRKNYEIIYADKHNIYMLLPSARGKICINSTSKTTWEKFADVEVLVAKGLCSECYANTFQLKRPLPDIVLLCIKFLK